MKLIIGIIFLLLFTTCVKIHSKIDYHPLENFKLPQGQIYLKGWMKFSKNLMLSKDSKDFEVNPKFEEQSKEKNLDTSLKDAGGFVNIPNRESFYFMITKLSIVILTGRKKSQTSLKEIFPLKDFDSCTSESKFEGGLNDFGDDDDGYCFTLKYKNKEDKIKVCLYSSEEKLHMMNILFQFLKPSSTLIPKEISNQPNGEHPLIKENDKNTSNGGQSIIKEGSRGDNDIPSSLGNSKKEKETPLENTKEPEAKDTERDWEVVVPWSPCSNQCGGGKTFMERKCVLTSGTCKGEKILSKDCNTHPCNTDTTPPKYKRCGYKEGKVSLLIESGHLTGTKIPVMLKLSSNTLKAYSFDNEENEVLSFSLSLVTGIRHYDKDNTQVCFEVEEEVTKKAIFCAIEKERGSTVKCEWMKDILDFIKNCNHISAPNLVYQPRPSYRKDRKALIENLEENDKEEAEKIILLTQKMGIEAIKQELNVENSIEKEHELKQKLFEESYEREIEKLKQQYEEISHDIEGKRKEEEEKYKKELLKGKVSEITAEIKKQILKIREGLTKRIESRERDAKRKRELMQAKIDELKKEIANEVIRASHKGDGDVCDPWQGKEKISSYCEKNYNDAKGDKRKECVQHDKFCYMCCESEFGDIYFSERHKCYSKCNSFYLEKNRIPFTEKVTKQESLENLEKETNKKVDKVPEQSEQNGEEVEKKKKLLKLIQLNLRKQ